jgi:hypothetical protein
MCHVIQHPVLAIQQPAVQPEHTGQQSGQVHIDLAIVCSTHAW